MSVWYETPDPREVCKVKPPPDEEQMRISLPSIEELEEELEDLRKRLNSIDWLFISILGKREDLAELVIEKKRKIAQVKGEEPIIIRPEVEEYRLKQAEEWAKECKINPHFARALLYIIICESCRTQINKLQSKPSRMDEVYAKGDRKTQIGLLACNLMFLTKEIAPIYDEMYGENAPFATRSYIDFEEMVLQQEISALRMKDNIDLAVDWGCATGRLAFQLAPHFKKVSGFDVSREMILHAKEKAKTSKCDNVDFQFINWPGQKLPLENNCASLVVMNLGTAGDVPEFRMVAKEIERILKNDGRFFLSFYNAAALFYRWYIPWPIELAAKIDREKHCLDIYRGDNVFKVFAQPYTKREVKNFVGKAGLTVSCILTYPTIASILPSEFFKEEESRDAIEKIDRKLADFNNGAYILVTGRKISEPSS